MRLTRKFSDCKDDTCPAIYETDDPGLLAVQGSLLTDPEALTDLGKVPGHERVVLIPRRLLAAYQPDGR